MLSGSSAAPERLESADSPEDVMPNGVNRRSAEVPGRLALGLMAGTSLDGVDAALVRLSGSLDRPKVRLRAFITMPYASDLCARLFRIAGGEPTTAGELSDLNFRVGEAFARAALSVCKRAGVEPRRLAVIGSHGQTIYHQGLASGRGRASTLQIGEAALIAYETGAPVVADFRPADVAAGGEGAPLVPMVDYLLLHDDRQGTVALNIGGIANVTVIPRRARPRDVFGFDTGPGNMVMDALVRHFTRGRRHYDTEGRTAARAKVINALLEECLNFPFLRRRPPKSAGREQFGGEFVRRHFLGRSKHWEDLLRTSAELTVQSIAEALSRFVFPDLRPGRDIHRLVVSGGGAHNKLLLSRLRELVSQLPVQISDRYGLSVDAKEAIAFAVLADRTLHGLAGNLPSVTGAGRSVVLGKLVRV
jgi:anhydro-N-acetylmuramic acid kinase